MMRALLLFILFPVFALAATPNTPWQENDRVAVRIISGVNAVGDLSQIPLGLDVKLKDDWHSYWRSPGESGLPPQLDISGSQNISRVDMSYPWPLRKTILGIDNILYEHAVVYPLNAILEKPGQNAQLNVALSLLTCADICVPNDFRFTLPLPAGPGVPSEFAGALAEAQKHVPSRTNNPQIDIDAQNATIIAEPAGIEFTLLGANITPATEIILENDLALSFSAPQFTDGPNGTMRVVMPLADATQLPALQTLKNITLNVHAGTSTADAVSAGVLRIREISLPLSGALAVAPAQDKPAPIDISASTTSSLGLILLLAFLGGFILNIMPCVLPVLSLKIVSVLKHHAHHQAKQVRGHFLASSAGIITSFLLIGGMLVMLREAGQTVGWGVQFQQPVFITALSVIITLFAANMLGLFEFQLPHSLANTLHSASNKPGYTGDFLQGAFATLMATPCSAPFLGTAVAFALAAPSPIILLIFLFMGFGLATPYLLLALQPAWLAHLPKPGAWMGKLRAVLGMFLLASLAWLLFVLSAQLPGESWQAIIACLGMMLILFYLRRTLPHPASAIAASFIGLVILAGLIIAAFPPAQNVPETRAASGVLTGHVLPWQEFAEEKITPAVMAGKTVFVDVTARWCLTCIYNKRTVLENADLAPLLSRPNILMLQADWTKPNATILNYLRKHGRTGIPFNIVYGPSAPEGIILPELLTIEAVKDALLKAGE